MKAINIGDRLFYHIDPDRDDKFAALVTKVGTNDRLHLTVFAPGQILFFENVRPVGDPIFERSAELRTNGAWSMPDPDPVTNPEPGDQTSKEPVTETSQPKPEPEPEAKSLPKSPPKRSVKR